MNEIAQLDFWAGIIMFKQQSIINHALNLMLCMIFNYIILQTLMIQIPLANSIKRPHGTSAKRTTMHENPQNCQTVISSNNNKTLHPFNGSVGLISRSRTWQIYTHTQLPERSTKHDLVNTRTHTDITAPHKTAGLSTPCRDVMTGAS